MASGATDPKKIGQGKGPAQNPPPLGPGDWRAFAWYKDNCSEFDSDFGLTSSEFDALGLSACQRRLFKLKLGEIHRTAKRIALEKAERERK